MSESFTQYLIYSFMFIMMASQRCLFEASSKIYDITLQALLCNLPPSFKDHRKAKNLYLSRYGEIWVDKMKSSTAMSKLCWPKNATFKYEQEGRFLLGVANIKSKNGTITCKRCPVFDYSGRKIVTIDAYKK